MTGKTTILMKIIQNRGEMLLVKGDHHQTPIYIYKNKLFVCWLTSCMFVDWRHYKDWELIRQEEYNYILKCRQLFHQIHRWYVCKNWTRTLAIYQSESDQLRSEQYIHLRDAVVNDGNTTNVGRLTILPSSHAGSPRHMHEYAQDAIAYVRLYGRPDLFITFTCNQSWEEIRQLLLQGQSAVHKHDITARVFRQKLKSQINYIVKLKVFGSVRRWMYSVNGKNEDCHTHIF